MVFVQESLFYLFEFQVQNDVNWGFDIFDDHIGVQWHDDLSFFQFFLWCWYVILYYKITQYCIFTSSRVFCLIPKYNSAMASLRFPKCLCSVLGSMFAMSSSCNLFYPFLLSFFAWLFAYALISAKVFWSIVLREDGKLPPPCSCLDSWYEMILDLYTSSSSSVCISSPGYLSLMTSRGWFLSSSLEGSCCCEPVLIFPVELMRLRILWRFWVWAAPPPLPVETLYW